MWAWGDGATGTLAQNNEVQYSSPVQIPGTAWIWPQSSYGVGDQCGAVRTDGTIWVWGSNDKGGLGQNNKTNYSSPRQIGTGTDWSYFSNAGARAGYAIKTDGTLWTWGSNSGALGHNNRTTYSSPRQVPGTTWGNNIWGNGQTSYMTKTDGTLWVIGQQQHGSLGLNNASDGRSSPVQMGTDTDWKRVVAGNYAAFATKTNGELWAWGNNNGYTLDLTQYSSPIQIPGTDWNFDNAQTLSATVHVLRKGP